jgi:hypothetical protein
VALSKPIQITLDDETIQRLLASITIHEDFHVHVHLYVDGSLKIDDQRSASNGATKAVLILNTGEINMPPGTITVDTENETATVSFVDDKGDTTTAPSGATVTFSSSDTTIATIDPDSSNPFQGDVTPVSVGTVTLSATFAGSALEADGVTPIADPDPVTVTIDPGAAVGARIALAV